LIKAVVADFKTSEGRSTIQEALKKRFAGTKPADVIQRSLANLRDSRRSDAKAPGDSAAFKAWLGRISQRVAQASKEGSVLDFGGVQVSDAERATLADISKALGATQLSLQLSAQMASP
jgi:hypothetical protein